MIGSTLLHLGAPTADAVPTVVVVAIAAVEAAIVLGLALAALARRRSGPYLLVAAAIAALLARSVVAGLAFTGALHAADHHLIEHGLDVALASLVIAAVYYARTVEREVDARP